MGLSGILIWVIFIIALVVSSKLVNAVYRMYMRMIGANTMYFNGPKKLLIIGFIALVITALVLNVLGIEIPR